MQEADRQILKTQLGVASRVSSGYKETENLWSMCVCVQGCVHQGTFLSLQI